MSSQGSRLTQVQMRYQQKQMHETTQRKIDMFDDTQKLLTSSLGAGKVRAMFERRNKAGIDKSYLLEPIVDAKIPSTKRVIAPSKPTRLDHKMSNYSKVIVPPLPNRQDINGNKSFNLSDAPLDRTFRGGLNGAKTLSNAKIVSATMGNARKLTPSVSSPPPLSNLTNKASPVRSMRSGNSTTSSSNSLRSMASPKSVSSGQTKTTATVGKARLAEAPVKKVNSTQSSVDEVDDAPVPDGLKRCPNCKRNFAEDRIEKHKVICEKTKKKRKVFDASKKRVQGTEAETYLKKPISSARTKKGIVAVAAPKTNQNWRSKHEDFIKTIRAAKEMTAHLAKGGKLSDLPPPPPSDNPDYVQCPHCLRRFNAAAAHRHIPACKDMQHNKSKPKPSNSTAGKVTSFTKRR